MKRVQISNHLLDRLKERLNEFSEIDIQNKLRNQFFKNIKLVSNHHFENYIDYAVKLGEFEPNKNSKYYYEIDGRDYYRLNDFFGKDSTGNEIWVIVRRNRLITVMLRKTIQPYSKMRCDKIIRNVNELIF
ncbi:hypothetical protein HYO65_gp192 [Tenacibaculum phage PTm1]|uniref:Uncharacterized protein n=2 Tax=Shirahamavirus PTm1 TaxID=2846435 RepID=A0A5S9HXM4_9CAUD|nr:hypothetical protein HYO65_gp192 [Tenacibaculum phage PTm1]BBI90584.1 hypothetical protein [Tenacibaculum phage PTm1]BBI90892.1 hypothetical protein [Tenacibaculum phage PTm5]